LSIRIVFLGSPEFAVPGLRALVADPSLEVVLVVAQPDRPSGRGRRLTSTPIARAAAELGIDVFQPVGLRDEARVQRLREARPDVLIVVAYGELLRRKVLELAARRMSTVVAAALSWSITDPGRDPGRRSGDRHVNHQTRPQPRRRPAHRSATTGHNTR
jgi:hypothetical protein